MERMGPLYLAGTVAAVSLVAGCSPDRHSTPYEPAASQDPLVTQLANLGFRGDMIKDRGSYFEVEGDIAISKAAVPKLAGSRLFSTIDLASGRQQSSDTSRARRQWNTDQTASQSQVNNIVVDLSGLANIPSWQTAAHFALAEWNVINCSNVHFVEGSPADITFITGSLASNVAAQASFPADAAPGSGKPGPTVTVNTVYTGTPNSDQTKLRNMVHELGHTLGYRHTNWQGKETQYPYGANLVAGTPQTDASSVMNGGTADQAWNGFSFYDTKATQALYPAVCGPAVGISGPTSVALYSSNQYTANASGSTPPYTYQWRGRQYEPSYGWGNWQDFYSTGTQNYTYAGVTSPGLTQFQLQALVTDASGAKTASTVTVSVHNP